MTKNKSKKSKKILNLCCKEQDVVFRAARRGRTGGQFTAPTMEELKKLVIKAGWSGDIKVTRLFVEKPEPVLASKSKSVAFDAAGENNEVV